MSAGWETAAVWLLLVNLTGFVLMGADKYRAKHDLWRIPERTLFLPALLGGTPGVMLGMKLFRHKTRHRKFRQGLPALLTLQVCAVLWLTRGQ